MVKRTRLAREDRRLQLLHAAREIVRLNGADALTLVSLAEAAGVTRPVVYDQFGTRAGLLTALYAEIAEQQFAILKEQLKFTRPDFNSVAETASVAYMRCYATIGPEAFAIVAALKGDAIMEEFAQELLRRYVRAFVDALRPYTELAEGQAIIRCTAIIGAAEALAAMMLRDEIDETEATENLQSLIKSWSVGHS